MVLQERIELSTSPLPRVCSTTELLQHLVRMVGPFSDWRLIRRYRGAVQVQFVPNRSGLLDALRALR